MESPSYGNDAVLSTTQLVQYEDDEENDDKIDSSQSDHIPPSRGTMEEMAGNETITRDTEGQVQVDGAELDVYEGMGVEEMEVEPCVKGVEAGLEVDRADEGDQDAQGYSVGGEREVQDGPEGEGYGEAKAVSHDELVLDEGENAPGVTDGGDLAAEAMRVFCSFTTTEVGHTEVTTSSTHGGVVNVTEYSHDDELQERVTEEAGQDESAQGDQSGGYIPEEAGRGEENSSFSTLQQLQLRAQILVYGDLIKGVLPEESLMSTAFSDGQEAFGPESDRSSTAGWNWERSWQVAAERQAEQAEVEREADAERMKSKGDVTMTEGEVVNTVADNLEPGTPSTSPSRVAEESLKEEVFPTVMPHTTDTADLTVANLDAPSLDVNGESSGLLTVNLDAVVNNIVATTVNSIDSDLLKDSRLVLGGVLSTEAGPVIDTSAGSPQVTPVEGIPLVSEAGHAQGTRSPSLDPWLKAPYTAPRPLSGSVPYINQGTQSAARQSGSWGSPSQPISNRVSDTTSQQAVVNSSATNLPHTNVISAPYTSPPVTGGIAAGVTPTPLGNAANVEDNPGSRKRKTGAGRGREKKTPTPRSNTGTPRPRAKKGSAGRGVSLVTSPDPRFPTPSLLVYESSTAVGLASGASPASPKPQTIGDKRDLMTRSNLHADTANWVEQAKVSFEEAVSAANSAAEQVQLLNTQTPPYNRISGKQEQYASAAAAVSAAASVAKAAAEAAKVAYEAALQARLYVVDNLEGSTGRTSAASSRADKDGGPGGRRSAIAAAKEEARKRASGTPTASKITPQSTDAVLRAARLMAEAASQAGAVLAKGNSIPSSPMLSSQTPETVPKADGKKSKSAEKRGPARREAVEIGTGNTQQTPVKEKDVKGSMKKGARRKGKDIIQSAAGKGSPNKGEDGPPKVSPEKPLRRQLDQSMASASYTAHTLQSFTKGSLVEVMNDEEGLRGGWFSAQVLDVSGGRAEVQYDEILTDDGSSKLKEWFSLEGSLDGPVPGRPRIRLVSPDNMAREEGRRKRRRTASGNRIWAVGDRVDAFVQDGWWEGVVKAVDDDDENKVTVHFPGEGDTQVVKGWNLRPSLVWKDGKWEQWSRSSNDRSQEKEEGNSAKRQKTGASPKAQARKSGRKPSNEVKASEDGANSPRGTRRGKSLDPHGDKLPSPAVVTTRSSPRQKIPPKRKEGLIKLASPESEVSTPTQVSTPVSTRARSLPQDAVNPVKEPSKGRSPTSGSASRKQPPLSPTVGKKKNQLQENVATPSNLRNSLRTNSQQTPNPVIGTPTTRQKAKAGASAQNLRSARARKALST